MQRCSSVLITSRDGPLSTQRERPHYRHSCEKVLPYTDLEFVSLALHVHKENKPHLLSPRRLLGHVTIENKIKDTL